MYLTSVKPWLTRALADALFNALSARPAGALILTPFLKLFTAVTANPSPSSVPTDFTEATFTGYAGVAITLPLTGPMNVTGTVVGGGGEGNFIAGSGITPPGQSILGYYLVDDNAAPTKVYLSELFTAPIAIVNPGDFISLDIIFGVDMNPSVQ